MIRRWQEATSPLWLQMLLVLVLATAHAVRAARAGGVLYSLVDDPLTCAKVEPVAVPKNTSRCDYEWHENRTAPDVRCALIGGYKPLAQGFSTYIYNSATYRVSETEVAPSGRPCMRQVRYEMRKVDSLVGLNVPVREDEPLLEIVKSERGPEGEEGDALVALISQGFRAITLDLAPSAISAKGVLFSNYTCRTCPVDLRVLRYQREVSVIRLYMNRAWRVYMLYNPAYIHLAQFILDYLEPDAYAEEIEVHGGEAWGEPKLFPPLKHLRLLDLSDNGITYIKADIFEGIQDLTVLKLAHNKMTKLPEGISKLEKLKGLDIAANPSLSRDSIVEVLLPLKDLRWLNISYIPVNGFEPLAANNNSLVPALEILEANNCNISDLSSDVAHHFFLEHLQLQIVRLANNPLRSIPPDTFSSLSHLQELDLSGTQLKSGPRLILVRGVSLRLLSLSNNNFSSPEHILFDNATSVDVLDLSGNHLKLWKNYAFPVVRTLNLSNADVVTLDADMIASLRGVERVDLGGNSIDCSACSTPALQKWLREDTRPALLALGEEAPLRCSFPPSQRGVLVTEVPGDERCRGPQTLLGAGAVIGAVVCSLLASLAFLGALAFRYRMEITYVVHLLRVNRAVADKNSSQQCEFDAFVCYSKYDRAWVIGELLPRLEGGNPRYRLCLHERDFRLGGLIVQNIVDCMHRSRHTIIVLTRAFVESQWCQWELEMATHRLLEGARDFLILVELERLDSRTLPRLLRLLVETRTFLEWPAIEAANSDAAVTDLAWKRLKSALGKPLKDREETSQLTVLPVPQILVTKDSVSADKILPITEANTHTV